MRNENAYFTGRMAEKKQQQSWNAFCQSGSVADYLQYRENCIRSEGIADAGTSDCQGSGYTGNTIS